MKEALRQIVDAFHRSHSEHVASQAFGLSEDIVYDAPLVGRSEEQKNDTISAETSYCRICSRRRPLNKEKG